MRWFFFLLALSRTTLGQASPPCPSGQCAEATPGADAGQLVADQQEPDQRQRARYWTRYSIGAGLGYATMRDSSIGGTLYSLQVGLRQQLTKNLGLHLRLIGNLATTNVWATTPTDNTYRKSLYVTESGACIGPYFGPFGRFYLGPVILIGYRWYSASTTDSSSVAAWVLPNGLIREPGLRAGILAGSEEQTDVSAIVTSSLDVDTAVRFLVGISHELR